MEAEESPIKYLIINDDYEIRKAIKATDALLCLWDLKQYLRSQLKYNEEKLTSKELKIIEVVNEKLLEILEDFDINLDKLII